MAHCQERGSFLLASFRSNSKVSWIHSSLTPSNSQLMEKVSTKRAKRTIRIRSIQWPAGFHNKKQMSHGLCSILVMAGTLTKLMDWAWWRWMTSGVWDFKPTSSNLGGSLSFSTSLGSKSGRNSVYLSREGGDFDMTEALVWGLAQ